MRGKYSAQARVWHAATEVQEEAGQQAGGGSEVRGRPTPSVGAASPVRGPVRRAEVPIAGSLVLGGTAHGHGLVGGGWVGAWGVGGAWGGGIGGGGSGGGSLMAWVSAGVAWAQRHVLFLAALILFLYSLVAVFHASNTPADPRIGGDGSAARLAALRSHCGPSSAQGAHSSGASSSLQGGGAFGLGLGQRQGIPSRVIVPPPHPLSRSVARVLLKATAVLSLSQSVPRAVRVAGPGGRAREGVGGGREEDGGGRAGSRGGREGGGSGGDGGGVGGMRGGEGDWLENTDDPQSQSQLQSEESQSDDSQSPSARLSLTIFCAPKPYLSASPASDPQRRALLSWLRLSLRPTVVLLGNDSSFHALAKEFPGRVVVDARVDTNFYGVPLVHSMLARARAAPTMVSLLINGDILLLEDVVPALSKVQRTFKSWVLTAARWDVSADFPFALEAREGGGAEGEGAGGAGGGGGAGEEVEEGGGGEGEGIRQAAEGEWLVIGEGSGASTDSSGSSSSGGGKRRSYLVGSSVVEAEVRRYVRRQGSLHTYGGVDFWAWNNYVHGTHAHTSSSSGSRRGLSEGSSDGEWEGGSGNREGGASGGSGGDGGEGGEGGEEGSEGKDNTPLFAGEMPPFAFGRGKYDNWLTHEIVAAGLRQMVDASDAVTSVHVAHSYSHVVSGGVAAAKAGLSFWSTRKQSSWELYANIHMSQTHGSYRNQKGTALHIPWRLLSCFDAAASNMCLQRRVRPANCTCEYSSFVPASQSDPRWEKGSTVCGTLSIDHDRDFTINPLPTPRSPPGLPHTLEQLLPQLARNITAAAAAAAAAAGGGGSGAGGVAGVGAGRGGGGGGGGEDEQEQQEQEQLRVVTLVAVTFTYADMLMSFVCRLRALGLADNLLVAALDAEMYRFAFLQGLAVYLEPGASSSLEKHASLGTDAASPFRDCPFGSPCFQAFTKLKSRAVLRVLRAGYSVLLSDVDVVWFKDPLPYLLAFGPGTLPIQSNEPNASLPGTGIRRINSGFYFARAEKMVVEAFEAIVRHAGKTKLSEQPSFYDVLCGAQGELVVRELKQKQPLQQQQQWGGGGQATQWWLGSGGRKEQGGGLGGVKAGEEEEESCIWKNGLRTILLNRSLFPNGAVHKLWERASVGRACRAKGCVVLHNNWITGHAEKRERMKRHGFWHYDVARRMCVWGWHEEYGGEREDADADARAASGRADSR